MWKINNYTGLEEYIKNNETVGFILDEHFVKYTYLYYKGQPVLMGKYPTEELARKRIENVYN